jgi:hypothetical protein
MATKLSESFANGFALLSLLALHKVAAGKMFSPGEGRL